MITTKVIVLHVKAGYEERERHIRNMLGAEGIDFEFLLDGDMADLTPEVFDRYFTDDMKQVTTLPSMLLKRLWTM